MNEFESGFEAVVGLEVHCQLATESKIFCSCRARLPGGKSVADIEPNANTCPVCTAQPGALPVLNRKVVEYAVRAGLATGCRINLKNVFARKNYFYPDLPKGYQISQYELPICEEGRLEIETSSGARKIRIQRIHMEEDAGKNVHLAGHSVVNLNRAGVPLVEIVSGPDMKSSEEAGAYLRALYGIVTFLGINDGNLQEGNFRCDANVSVMPKGSRQFGTRTEIKNVNSFRFIEKAIDYEIARQIEVIRAGGKIVQETRGYDSSKNATFSMRSKEEAQDYRYFPDPDLMPIQLDAAWVEEVRAALPELPAQRKARFMKELGLSADDGGLLISSRAVAEYFEETMKLLGSAAKANAKAAANLLTGELTRLANEQNIEIGESQVRPKHLADLVRMLQASELSSTGAKQVLGIAWQSGESVATIVGREGLKQVSDLGAIEPAVDKILAAHAAQVAEFQAGKEKVLGFLVGQVMKETAGRANPGLIQQVLRKKLGGASK